MRSMAIVLAFLTLSQVAAGATLDVPAPYLTIQAALNAATSGDIVLVAPGTYHEHLQLGLGQAGVKLHSSAGAAATIIEADGTNFAIDVSNAAGVEIVGFTIQNGVRGGFTKGGGSAIENSTALMTDNVVQNCRAYWGGGIYVDAASSATIARNTIRDNTCNSFGGGIDYEGRPGQIDGNVIANNHAGLFSGGLAVAPDMVISNNHFLSNDANQAGAMSAHGHQIVRGNEFRGNSARFSGAMSASDGALVDNNTFAGNSAGERGGALEAGGSSALSHNLFLDNSTQGDGGAIYAFGSQTIQGNVIARNSSLNNGGGIMIDASATALLENNTIVLNTAPKGGGILITNSSRATLNNNIVSHSQAGGGVVRDASQWAVLSSCNDVWGNAGGDYLGTPNPTGSTGNISSDPLYCNLATIDFHLSGVSLCAPAHSGTCGLIGALDVGCEGPVRTEITTWGGLKARYR